MDYRKVNQIAEDPSRVRMIAEQILAKPYFKRNVQTENFLQSLTKYDVEKPLTTRQKEEFYRLHQKSTRKAKAGKYTASKLLRKAYEARYDLCYEEHEEWLEQKTTYRQELYLTNEEWKRLFSICRQLEILYPDEFVPLDS